MICGTTVYVDGFSTAFSANKTVNCRGGYVGIGGHFSVGLDTTLGLKSGLQTSRLELEAGLKPTGIKVDLQITVCNGGVVNNAGFRMDEYAVMGYKTEST